MLQLIGCTITYSFSRIFQCDCTICFGYCYTKKMKTTNITAIKNNQTSIAYTIVNKTISSAMKAVFDFVSIIFLIGFIISLYIKSLKRK